MSDLAVQLKTDLEDALALATAEVSPADREKFARIVGRAGQHLAAGRMLVAGADLVTIEALMYADARKRAKAAYQALVTALVRAAVNGIVLA